MPSPQIFKVTNMSFNTIRENKILAKISEFTVIIINFACSRLSYYSLPETSLH